MKTIGIRELRQRASGVLRRIQAGEVIGVTDRGRLVAVISPPSSAVGAGALVASGRVRPARASWTSLPEPARVQLSTTAVLDELRSERT